VEVAPVFAVLFEVHPKTEKWDDYLGYAKLLKPELERIDGFIDNIRYRSLTRDGWLLSLSDWRNEKALVRWRTQAVHHGVQEKGRFEVFQDYHLRVGQVTADTALPAGQSLAEQRLDETSTGGTAVTLIDGKQDSGWVKQAKAEAVAAALGFTAEAGGRTSWDVFEAVLTPGDIILMQTWRDAAAAAFAHSAQPTKGSRLRRVRVVRDYGMFDRREAPQYYAEVKRA
jgi:heme-degrading monooxygenase HmoA/quinol monooxygenase YgiN